MILALDMGFKNQAWAKVQNGKLVSCGRISHPVNDLTDEAYEAQSKLFIEEFKTLCSGLNEEDVVVAERFQARRFNPGAQIEAVSLMLGIMTTVSPAPVKLVIASTWKNWMLRTYGENVMEHVLRDKHSNEDLYDEHVSDAIGIAYWYQTQMDGQTESPFISSFFPLKASCDTCWWKANGCRGVKTRICDEFVAADKRVKCFKCKFVLDCKKSVKEEYGVAKANKVNRATSGCEKFEEEVKAKGKKK